MSIAHLDRSRRQPAVKPDAAEFWRQGREPRLAEILADETLHCLMRRDGVSAAELNRVIDAARRQLARGLCRPRAA